MTTVEEKTIEYSLFELIDSAERRLEISFYKKGEVYGNIYKYGGQKTTSFAEKDSLTAWKVCLRLFEGDGFDMWMSAINQAKTLLNEVKEDLRHDCSNPNQFRRLIAKTRFKETYNTLYDNANPT